MTRDFSNTLRISEIFYSLQGESVRVGLPTVFIRLTGCPLRCQYCDTTHAFKGGEVLSIDNIIEQTNRLLHNAHPEHKYITVTGGEPLAQKGCLNFLSQLCDQGFKVSIETSGAFPIQDIDSRVMIILDLKTPASEEASKNLWDNLNYLKASDQIKFVICNQEDYHWAKEQLWANKLHEICEVLFSPSYTEIKLRDLAESILADKLPVRLQMQLHKQIWGEEQGR